MLLEPLVQLEHSQFLQYDEDNQNTQTKLVCTLEQKNSAVISGHHREKLLINLF